jgi:hypothetical protein
MANYHDTSLNISMHLNHADPSKVQFIPSHFQHDEERIETLEFRYKDEKITFYMTLAQMLALRAMLDMYLK